MASVNAQRVGNALTVARERYSDLLQAWDRDDNPNENFLNEIIMVEEHISLLSANAERQWYRVGARARRVVDQYS